MSGLTFYLAASYTRREELCAYRADLEALGYRVPARWLLGEHQVHGVEAARVIEQGGEVPARESLLFAQDDVEDITEADVFVAFTQAPGQPGGRRGGRHVELGYALALRAMHAAPAVYIVGPRENIFTALADGVYATWEEFLDAVVREDAEDAA